MGARIAIRQFLRARARNIGAARVAGYGKPRYTKGSIVTASSLSRSVRSVHARRRAGSKRELGSSRKGTALVCTIASQRAARGQAKKGTIILLCVLVAAIAGIWFWQMRGPAKEVSPIVSSGTRIGWCAACKKDFSVTGADVAGIAKQGDKLQCPMCKKFEANWGGPPEGANPSTGVVLP